MGPASFVEVPTGHLDGVPTNKAVRAPEPARSEIGTLAANGYHAVTMSQSVSARIFAGFLLVMLAFGGVIGYTVYRMHQVGRQLELINSRFLRLTLIVGELHTVQQNLLNTVAERAASPEPSKFVRRQVRLARQFRLHELRRAAVLAETTHSLDLPPRDQHMLAQIGRRLRALERAFVRNDPPFERLFSAEALPAVSVRRLVQDLEPKERKLASAIRRLRNDLRAYVKDAAVQVESDQQYGMWAGLALVLIALLVGVGVTFRARRTLRPLRTLVDGTKRIGSGDYVQRVPVESSDEIGLLAGEFNKMAAAVEEREQRLIHSERMAAAGMLAAHITHEVRNPLNSIALNTEMLEEELSTLETPASREAQLLCRAIQKEVDRLTETTEEYLRFARLPKPNLQREQVNELASQLVEFMAEELKRQHVVCQLDLAESLPMVDVDENQLRQALLNLLRNAGDALQECGGTVTVRTRQTDSNVEIVVADSGPGIARDHIDRVFEPFFSTKDRGTGLGLALTQRIIQQHGGTVSVASDAGTGTAFTVALPLVRRQDKISDSGQIGADEPPTSTG